MMMLEYERGGKCERKGRGKRRKGPDMIMSELRSGSR